ncbi:MAG: hypothetical protein ACLPH3_16470 [Terracidiphilus sp.]
MRRFADTARLPASPELPIVTETAERTVASWDALAEKELLPEDVRSSIGRQIFAVAATIPENRPLREER